MFDNRRKKIVPRLFKDIQHSSGRINLSNNLIASFLFERLEDDRIRNQVTGSNSLDNLKFINDSFNPVEPEVEKLEVEYSDPQVAPLLISDIPNPNNFDSLKSQLSAIKTIKEKKSSILVSDSPFKKKIENLNGQSVESSYYFQYQPEGFHSSLLSRYNGKSVNLTGRNFQSFNFKILKTSFSDLLNNLNGSTLKIGYNDAQGATTDTNFHIRLFEENASNPQCQIVLKGKSLNRNRDFTFSDESGNRGSFEFNLREQTPGTELVRFKVDGDYLNSVSYDDSSGNTIKLVGNAGYDLTKKFKYRTAASDIEFSKQSDLSLWLGLSPTPTVLGGDYSGTPSYVADVIESDVLIQIAPDIRDGVHSLYTKPQGESAPILNSRDYPHRIFDGIDDVVFLGPATNFTNFFGADNKRFAISFWIYPEQMEPGQTGTVISLDNGAFEIFVKPTVPSSDYLLLEMNITYRSGNGVNTAQYSYSENESQAKVKIGAWSQVIISKDLDGHSAFWQVQNRPDVLIHEANGRLNAGLEVGLNTFSGTLDNIAGSNAWIQAFAPGSTFYINDGPCYIGASKVDGDPTLINHFKGKLSEFAMWKTSLTPTERHLLTYLYRYREADSLHCLMVSLVDTINSSTNNIKASINVPEFAAGPIFQPMIVDARSGTSQILLLEHTADLDTKNASGHTTQHGVPTPIRDLVAIAPSANTENLVSSNPELASTWFSFNPEAPGGTNVGKKLEIRDDFFNKVSFEFTNIPQQSTAANAKTTNVYVTHPSYPYANSNWWEVANNLLSFKIKQNIAATEVGTLRLESDYNYTATDGATPSLSNAISIDGKGIALISKINSFTELKFTGRQVSDYDGFTFILEAPQQLNSSRIPRKFVFNYYTNELPVSPKNVYSVVNILISDQARATEGQSIPGYAALDDVTKLRQSVASLTLKAIKEYYTSTPKAQARISVGITNFNNNYYFSLNDGSNVVSFAPNSASATAARVDDNNYSFGIQNIANDINETVVLAKRIYDAIALAKADNNLQITAQDPTYPDLIDGSFVNQELHSNHIILTQDNTGAAGNTVITYQNDNGNLFFEDFTGGESFVCRPMNPPGTAPGGFGPTGVILDVGYDGSNFSVSANAQNSPGGYAVNQTHTLEFEGGQLGLYSRAFTVDMTVGGTAESPTYSFGNFTILESFDPCIELSTARIRIFDIVPSPGPGIGLELNSSGTFSGPTGDDISALNQFIVNRTASEEKISRELDLRIVDPSNNNSLVDNLIISHPPGIFSARSRNLPLNGANFISGSFDGTRHISAEDPLVGGKCVRFTLDEEDSFFTNLRNSIIENYDSTFTIPTFEEVNEYINEDLELENENRMFYKFSFYNFSGYSIPEPSNSAYYIRDELVTSNSPRTRFGFNGNVFYYPVYKNKSDAISASPNSIAYYADFLHYDDLLYFADGNFVASFSRPEDLNDIKNYQYIDFKDLNGVRHLESQESLNLEKFKGKIENFALVSMSSNGIESIGVSKTIVLRIKTPAVGISRPSSPTGTVFTLASSSRCRYQLMIQGGTFKFRAYPESSISGNSQIDVKFEAVAGSTVESNKWYTIFISFKENGFDKNSTNDHYFAIFDSENHGGLLEKNSFSDANGDSTGNILENLNGDPLLSIGYGDSDQGIITKTQSGKTDSSKYFKDFTISEINFFDKNLSIEEASKIAESHLQFRTKSGFQNELPKLLLKKIKNQESFDRSLVFKEGDRDLDIKSQKLIYPELQPAGTTGSISFRFSNVPANNSGVSFRLPDGTDFQVVADSSSSVRDGFTLDERTGNISNTVNGVSIETEILVNSINPLKFGVQDLANATGRDISIAFVNLINRTNRYLRRPIRASLQSDPAGDIAEFVKLEYLNAGSSSETYASNFFHILESDFNATALNSDFGEKIEPDYKYRFKNVDEENILKIGEDQLPSNTFASITCNVENIQSYLDLASISVDYYRGINSGLPISHPFRIPEVPVDLSEQGVTSSYRDRNVPFKPILRFSINGIQYRARLDSTRNYRESNRYNICTQGMNTSAKLAFALSTSINDAIQKDGIQLATTVAEGNLVKIYPAGRETYVSDVTFDGYGLRIFNGSSRLFSVVDFPVSLNPNVIRDIKTQEVKEIKKVTPFVDDDRVDPDSTFFSSGTEILSEATEHPRFQMRTADKVRIEIDINPTINTTLGLTTGSIGVGGQTEIKHGYQAGTFNPMGYFNFSEKKWESITSDSYTSKIETPNTSILKSNYTESDYPGKIDSTAQYRDVALALKTDFRMLTSLSTNFTNTVGPYILDPTRGSGCEVISQRGNNLQIGGITITPKNVDIGKFFDGAEIINWGQDQSRGFLIGDKVRIPISCIMTRVLDFEYFSLRSATGDSLSFKYLTSQNVNDMIANEKSGDPQFTLRVKNTVTIDQLYKILNHHYEGYSSEIAYFNLYKLDSQNEGRATITVETLNFSNNTKIAIMEQSPGGSVRTVVFTFQDNSAQPSKSSATSYTIGTQNANSRQTVASRIYDAITLANNNGDLSVTAVDPSNGYFWNLYLFTGTVGTAGLQNRQIFFSDHGDSLKLSPFEMPFAWPCNVLVSQDFVDFVKTFKIILSDFTQNHPLVKDLALTSVMELDTTFEFPADTVPPRTAYKNNIAFIGPPGTIIKISTDSGANGLNQPALEFKIYDQYFEPTFQKVPKAYDIRITSHDGSTFPEYGHIIQAINERVDPTGVTVIGTGVLEDMRRECRVSTNVNGVINDDPDSAIFLSPSGMADIQPTLYFSENSDGIGVSPPDIDPGPGVFYPPPYSFVNNGIPGASLEFEVGKLATHYTSVNRTDAISTAVSDFHKNTPIGFGGTYGFSIHRKDVFSNASMTMTTSGGGNVQIQTNESANQGDYWEIPLSEDEKYFTLTSASGKSAKFYLFDQARLPATKIKFHHRANFQSYLGMYYLPQFIFYKKPEFQADSLYSIYKGIRIEVSYEDRTLGRPSRAGTLIEILPPNSKDPESDGFITIRIVNDTNALHGTITESQTGQNEAAPFQCQAQWLLEAINHDVDRKIQNPGGNVENTLFTYVDRTQVGFRELFGVVMHGDSDFDNIDESLGTYDESVSYPSFDGSADWVGAGSPLNFGDPVHGPVISRNQESAITVPYFHNMRIGSLMKYIVTAAKQSSVAEEMTIEINPPITDENLHYVTLSNNSSSFLMSDETLNGASEEPYEITITQNLPGVSGNTSLFNRYDHGRHFKIAIAVSRNTTAPSFTEVIKYRNLANVLTNFVQNANESNVQDGQVHNDEPSNVYAGMKVMATGNDAAAQFFFGPTAGSKPSSSVDRFAGKMFRVEEGSQAFTTLYIARTTDPTGVYGSFASGINEYNKRYLDGGTFAADTDGNISVFGGQNSSFVLKFTGGAVGDKITISTYALPDAPYTIGNPDASEENGRIYITCAVNGEGTPYIPFRAFSSNFNKLTRNIVINGGVDGDISSSHFKGGIVQQDPNRESENAKSQFLELPLRARPISNFGFPFSSTYAPSAGQKLNLSKYLDGPFLLEKFEIICSSSIKDEVSEGFGRVLPETSREFPFSSFEDSHKTYGELVDESADAFTSRDPVYSFDATSSGNLARASYKNINRAASLSDTTKDKTYFGEYDGKSRTPFAQKLYDQFFFSTVSTGSAEIKNLFSINDEIGSQYNQSRMNKEFYFRTAGDSYNNPYVVNDNIRQPQNIPDAYTTTGNFLVKRESDLSIDGPTESFSNSTFRYSASDDSWTVVTNADGGFSVGDRLYFPPKQEPTGTLKRLVSGFVLEVLSVTTTPDAVGVNNKITAVGNFSTLNASSKGGSAWWRCDTFFLLREKPSVQRTFSIDTPKKSNSERKYANLSIEFNSLNTVSLKDRVVIKGLPGPLDRGSNPTYETTRLNKTRRIDGFHYVAPSNPTNPFDILNTPLLAGTQFTIDGEPRGIITQASEMGMTPQLTIRGDSSSARVLFYSDDSAVGLQYFRTIVKIPILKYPYLDSSGNNTIVGRWTGLQIIAFDPEEGIRYSDGNKVSQTIDLIIQQDPDLPIQYEIDSSAPSAPFFVNETVLIRTGGNLSSQTPHSDNGGINDYSLNQRLCPDDSTPILLRVTSVDSSGKPTGLEFAGHRGFNHDPTISSLGGHPSRIFSYMNSTEGDYSPQYNYDRHTSPATLSYNAEINVANNPERDTSKIPKELVLNYVLINVAAFRNAINLNQPPYRLIDIRSDIDQLGKITFFANIETPGFDAGEGPFIVNQFDGISPPDVSALTVPLNSQFAFLSSLETSIAAIDYMNLLGERGSISANLEDKSEPVLTISKNSQKIEGSLFGVTEFQATLHSETIFPRSTFTVDRIPHTYFPVADSLASTLFSNLSGSVNFLTASVSQKSDILEKNYFEPTFVNSGDPLNEVSPFLPNIISDFTKDSTVFEQSSLQKGYSSRELITYSQVAYYGYAQSNSIRLDSSQAATVSSGSINPGYLSSFYFVNNPAQLFYADSSRKKSQIHPHHQIFGSFESLSVTNGRNLLENGLGRDLNIKITSSKSEEVLLENSLMNEPSIFDSVGDIKISTPKLTYPKHPSFKNLKQDILGSDGITSIKFLEEKYINQFVPMKNSDSVFTLRLDSTSANAVSIMKNYYSDISVSDNLHSGIIRVQSNCKNTDRTNISFPYTLNVIDQYNNYSNDYLPEIANVTIGSTFIGGADPDGLGGANYHFTSTGDTPSEVGYSVFQLPRNLSSHDRKFPEKSVIDNSYSADSDIKPGNRFLRNNPYLLKPDDNIILGFQTAIPGFETGFASSLNIGGGNVPPELDDYGNVLSTRTKDITSSSLSYSLNTGRCIETTFSPYEGSKLVLYGSYVRNNFPVRNSKKLENQSEISEFYGETVYDQFDLQTDGEFVGSRLGEIRSKTTVRANPASFSISSTKLLPVIVDEDQPVDQFTFSFGELTNSITGSDDQSSTGVKKLFASGSVDRFIFLFDAESNFTDGGETICHDMIYYDSLPPNITSQVVQVIQPGTEELSKVFPYAYAQEKGMHVEEANGSVVHGIRESRGSLVFLVGAPDHSGMVDGVSDPKTREGIPMSIHDQAYNTTWRSSFVFEPEKDPQTGHITRDPANERQSSYEPNFGLDLDSFSRDGRYDVSGGLIVAQALPFSKKIVAIESNAPNVAPDLPAAANDGTHESGWGISGFNDDGKVSVDESFTHNSNAVAYAITGSYINNYQVPITLSNFVDQVDNNRIKQTAAILFGFSRTPNRNLETLISTENLPVGNTSALTDINSNNLLNNTFTYTNTTNSFRLAQQNPTQVLAHPRGVKYGMMNYAPLRPRVVFSRTHFGFFSDLVAGRPYAAFSLPAGSSPNVPEGFEIHEQHGATTPVEVRFFDPARNKIKAGRETFNLARRFLFSQNLDRFQRSGVPFFDFDEAGEDFGNGSGGRVRSSVDIHPEQISVFRAGEDLIDLD